MTLETLPPEVLGHICGYIDIESELPRDKFEAISGILRQSNNGRHVRTLVLDAEESNKATWQRLIEFLGFLTGLKSIECREDIALSLLAVWDPLPQCELFVRGFQMRGGLQREDYHLDPKFRLLTASCLTSLECDVSMRDFKRGRRVLNDDEDEEDEGEEDFADNELDQDMLMAQAESFHIAKVVSFLTSVVPNLRRLDLTRNYLYGSIEIPKRRARRAKLVHLDLSGLGNPQPMLFKHLQKSTDFEMLESLSLPDMSEYTCDWLDRNPMSLPRLKELKMHVQRGYMQYQGHDQDPWMYAENFLMNVPLLKKLELVGDYNYVVGDYNYVLGNCLEHHGTLESLTLHERDDVLHADFTTGIDLKLLDGILRCEKLTFLDVHVHRSKGDDGIWKMFQDSRLETLILTLDCQVEGFDSTFRNRKEVLECAATDEALARSFYDVCGLEYLMVTSTLTGVQAFNTEDRNTVRAVLRELTGSYEVTRVEGRVHVVEMAREMLQIDEDAIKLDSKIMDVFRSIWPFGGGDWRNSWHSLPLVVDT